MKFMVVWIGNSTLIEWRNMTDAATGDEVTGATVTATLQDADGAAIEGAEGLAVSHVSTGNYRGMIPHDLELADGDEGTVIMVADLSGSIYGRREIPFKAQVYAE